MQRLRRSSSFDNLMNKFKIKKSSRDAGDDFQRDSHMEYEGPSLEEIELNSRIKQWIRSSHPPETSLNIDSKSSTSQRYMKTESGLTDEERNAVGSHNSQTPRASRLNCEPISGLGRSKSWNNMHDSNNQEGEILFHPDFVDWRTCEQHSTNNSADEPQLLGVVFKDAHRSISRLLQWSG